MKHELIEYIYKQLDYECLSELRNSDVLRKNMQMIFCIPEEMFTLDDWKYLYRYITGENNDFKTIDDVKNALRNWMHKEFKNTPLE